MFNIYLPRILNVICTPHLKDRKEWSIRNNVNDQIGMLMDMNSLFFIIDAWCVPFNRYYARYKCTLHSTSVAWSCYKSSKIVQVYKFTSRICINAKYIYFYSTSYKTCSLQAIYTSSKYSLATKNGILCYNCVNISV